MVNGEHSERCHVLSEVPQGSVLGPPLFLIYINSLTFIPLSDSTRLILYADDLLIYKPILTETSHLQLQSDIKSISLWADNNLMTFNEAKCKCMLLTNKKITVFPIITLNDHPLHQIKYLGITFSHNLCWSPHIQTICKKAWRIIGILY